MRASRSAAPALATIGVVVLLVSSGATVARAFCRSTTCDTAIEVCDQDENLCVTEGAPLFWAEPCIELWLPEDQRGLEMVDRDAFVQTAHEAMVAWNEVRCGPEQSLPSVHVSVGGRAQCTETGYDPRAARNINTITVTDDVAAVFAAPVALTTVTYDPVAGRILDADIELNVADHVFTVGDQNVRTDLRSTLTHELGHALGLDHTTEAGATMLRSAPPGSTWMRTLEDDDRAGLCAISADPGASAPPSVAECAVREDAAEVCVQVAALRAAPPTGCSLQPARRVGAGVAGAGFAVVGLLLLAWRLRRRRV